MGCGQSREDSLSAVSKWDGLLADSREKLLRYEAARLIEYRGVEVFLSRGDAALPRIVGFGMACFEDIQIEVELRADSSAFATIPAVSQQDSANIEEDYIEGEHRRLWREKVGLRPALSEPLAEHKDLRTHLSAH